MEAEVINDFDSTLPYKIESVDEYNRIINTINKNGISFEMIEKLVSRLSTEIIESMKSLDTEGANILSAYFKVKEFEQVDTKKQIEMLCSDENLVGFVISLNSIAKSFSNKMLSCVYGENFEFRDDADNLLLSLSRVSKFILERGYDFENLQIEVCEYPENITTYRLYTLAYDLMITLEKKVDDVVIYQEDDEVKIFVAEYDPGFHKEDFKKIYDERIRRVIKQLPLKRYTFYNKMMLEINKIKEQLKLNEESRNWDINLELQERLDEMYAKLPYYDSDCEELGNVVNLYRYMSLSEFFKMSVGTKMKYGGEKHNAVTESEGFCFLLPRTVILAENAGKSWQTDELEEYESLEECGEPLYYGEKRIIVEGRDGPIYYDPSKLSIVTSNGTLLTADSEEMIRYIGGIVNTQVLVEFCVSSEFEYKTGMARYGTEFSLIDAENIWIQEVSAFEYDNRSLVPIRYALGQEYRAYESTMGLWRKCNININSNSNVREILNYMFEQENGAVSLNLNSLKFLPAINGTTQDEFYDSYTLGYWNEPREIGFYYKNPFNDENRYEVKFFRDKDNSYKILEIDEIPDFWKDIYDSKMSFQSKEMVEKFLTYMAIVASYPEVKLEFDFDRDTGMLKSRNSEKMINMKNLELIKRKSGEIDIVSKYTKESILALKQSQKRLAIQTDERKTCISAETLGMAVYDATTSLCIEEEKALNKMSLGQNYNDNKQREFE